MNAMGPRKKFYQAALEEKDTTKVAGLAAEGVGFSSTYEGVSIVERVYNSVVAMTNIEVIEVFLRAGYFFYTVEGIEEIIVYPIFAIEILNFLANVCAQLKLLGFKPLTGINSHRRSNRQRSATERAYDTCDIRFGRRFFAPWELPSA